jgi:hypothetical protein
MGSAGATEVATSKEAARQSKPAAMEGRGAIARRAYLKLKSPNIFYAWQRTAESGARTPRECQLIDM